MKLHADLWRCQEYERTGYVWEQYDALTGEGRRRFVGRCIRIYGGPDYHYLLQSPIHWLDITGHTECVFHSPLRDIVPVYLTPTLLHSYI